MDNPSAGSRPAKSRSQALDIIEYPAPRYGYERHTEVLNVQLLDTAQVHHETSKQGILEGNPSTNGVRITHNWRWTREHPIEVRGERTIEAPAGSTIRFARTVEPRSSQHTPSPQPSGSQSVPFVPQSPQASGSHPAHERASHSSGTPSVLSPTLHDASATPIDRRAGARHDAGRAQGASSPTPPVTPDDRWRCGANGHANAEANEALGTPDRERVLETLKRYERYAEPNPPVDRASSSSSSSISTSTSSSSTIVERGYLQSPQPPANPSPASNGLKLTAEDGTVFYMMATTEAPHIQEYYRLHPDRARPHHRSALPLKSAIRSASRNENRDEDEDTGGVQRSRLCRAPGRYDFGNEEFFIPPLPSPRQQPTPPNDEDDGGGGVSEPRPPRRGAHTRPSTSRGVRSLLKRVRRTVFPCTATGTPAPSRSRNAEPSSRPWRREQVHARPLPDPPVSVYPVYYTVPNQGFLPPVSIHPVGPPNYGLSSRSICQHPASHHLNCPALRQPTPAPPPPQQPRDPVGSRSASRATQREDRREDRRERHNRPSEHHRHAHRSRRHHAEDTDTGTSRTPTDADATTTSSSSSASAPQEPPRRSTNRAGQIGTYVEGSPARMDYWSVPPIARTQSAAPDQSPPPVVPSPPQRFREQDPAPERFADSPESEPRRHRRHRRRDVVTDVAVIPNTVPDNASSRSSNCSSRDRSTLNTQLETPPPSREPSPNTPMSQNVPIPQAPPQPVPAVWAQPTIPAGFPFPAMFPAIAWVPHPQPHPTIPAATFWQLPRGFPRVPTPAAASMTGGWPLPGTAGGTWRTPAWPLPVPLVRTPSGASTSSLPRTHTPARNAPQLAPDLNGPRPIICPYLIPNPGNPSVPWLDWDLRMPPSLAKRYTARETVASISDKLDEVATHPPVARLEVVYTTAVPAMLNYWGAIAVDAGQGGTVTVTVGAVLDAVHDFFQVPLTHAEAAELKHAHPAEWRKMASAFRKRCRDYPALADVTHRQGMRRVDVLADRYKWWGMWVHWNPDGTWYLNLGLVPKNPPR